MIRILGDMIKKSIIKSCIKSRLFGFISDEATDVATMEQMTICILAKSSNRPPIIY